MEGTEHLTMEAKQNDIFFQRQEIEELTATIANLTAIMETAFKDAYKKVAELEAHIIELRNRINTTTTGTTSTRTDDSEMKRIMNTDLLKGHEFAKLNKRTNMRSGSTALRTICIVRCQMLGSSLDLPKILHRTTTATKCSRPKL